MSSTQGEGSIEVVREIQATPDRVFRALTQAKDLESWWGAKTEWWLEKAQVDARPGGRYHLDFRSTDGKSVFVEGEFKVVDPPRRIVQTWRASMYPGLENRVEYRLEPVAGGTRLTVIHSGFADDPKVRADYESGWVEVLLKLVTWLIAVAPVVGLTGFGDARE